MHRPHLIGAFSSDTYLRGRALHTKQAERNRTRVSCDYSPFMNMKIHFSAILLAAFVAPQAKAALPEATEVERGPHHRLWQRSIDIAGPSGKTRKQYSSFVELQTGLHRWTDQGWAVTDPRIEIFPDGAIVRNLQYSVIFSPSLADGGSLDILLPNGRDGQPGQRLRGHLLGLAYREGNRFVFISEVKECAGVIGGAEQNELTFADAFSDFPINVKYVVQRGKLSQSIILQNRLPHPREVGLSDAAEILLMTEWINFAAPQRQQRALQEAKGGQHALMDEQIEFGPMEFIAGKDLYRRARDRDFHCGSQELGGVAR